MGSFKRVWFALMAMVLSLLAVPAFAVIDIATATTGISDAQTALLALLGGLIGLSAAIFGVVKVYAFLSRRAGA